MPFASSASLSPLQRRLFFTASRRSMREMEEILARLLAARLSELDESACQALLTLLQETDGDLLDWLGGIVPPPARVEASVLEWLRPYCQG